MRFAAPSLPDDLRAEQPSGAALGDDLHGDRPAARVVAGAGRRFDRRVANVEARRRVASRSVSPVRAISYSQILVTAVPIDAGERRVAAGHVDADDPSLLVRVGAERDRDRPAADAVMALDAVAGGPDTVRRWWPCAASVAIPPVGRSRSRPRRASVDVGLHAEAEHDDVGRDTCRSPITTARTWPSASVSNASTLVSVMQRRCRGRGSRRRRARPCRGRACASAARRPSTTVTCRPRRCSASAISSPM